jgi:hypothetical protein
MFTLAAKACLGWTQIGAASGIAAEVATRASPVGAAKPRVSATDPHSPLSARRATLNSPVVAVSLLARPQGLVSRKINHSRHARVFAEPEGPSAFRSPECV